MKRFFIIIIVIAGISVFITACKKDKIKGSIPVITLLGNSPVNAGIGYTYKDAGATATDSEDGNITSKIISVNNVDSSKSGNYFVFFNVTDKDGNKAFQVIRTVNVINTK